MERLAAPVSESSKDSDGSGAEPANGTVQPTAAIRGRNLFTGGGGETGASTGARNGRVGEGGGSRAGEARALMPKPRGR